MFRAGFGTAKEEPRRMTFQQGRRGCPEYSRLHEARPCPSRRLTALPVSHAVSRSWTMAMRLCCFLPIGPPCKITPAKPPSRDTIQFMSVQIFLSTASDEFRAYRDQLHRDLTRHNVDVKVQEDFKDYGGVTLDKLDLYISHCDAVVHLVGDMTGADANSASVQAIRAKYHDLADKLPPLGRALDDGTAISYTQWEAWLALYHGKPLLIARADDAAPRGPNFAPTDASRAAQQAHLVRLRAVERCPGCRFTSPDNLAKYILVSVILDLLVEERSL